MVVKTKVNRKALGNGLSLYWRANKVGGREYFSDEIGGGVFVWDTTLVDKTTLLAAILQEEKLNRKADMKKYRKSKQ